jgi:PhnB protein
MPSTLNPYINYRGTAREAMEFYKSVFGGELTVSTFREFGMTEWPDQLDNVMHSQLNGPNGLVLMGADVPETMEVSFGDNISISLSGDDEAELTGWFEKLSEGGSTITPLAKAPWGDTFGQFMDRYGVKWQVNIAGEQPPA